MSKTCNFLGLRSNHLPPFISSTANSPFLRASSALNLPTVASRPFDRRIRSSSRRRLVLGGFAGASLWMNNMSGNIGGKSFIASARQTNPSPVEQVFFSLFVRSEFRINSYLFKVFCWQTCVQKGLAGDLKKAMKDGKPMIIEGRHLDPSIYLMKDENKIHQMNLPWLHLTATIIN